MATCRARPLATCPRPAPVRIWREDLEVVQTIEALDGPGSVISTEQSKYAPVLLACVEVVSGSKPFDSDRKTDVSTFFTVYRFECALILGKWWGSMRERS